MLKTLRENHLKTVLWIVTVIISVTFIFWGAAYYLSDRQQEFVGTIGKKKISRREFENNVRMAELSYTLMYGDEFRRFINQETLAQKGWETLMLAWKADKENIQVPDLQVAENIKKMFFGENKFNKEVYEKTLRRNLRVDPRTFEENVRLSMRIEKLYDKYIKAQVEDKEVTDSYRLENQKLKFNYVLIPYAKFSGNEKEKVTAQDMEKKALELGQTVLKAAQAIKPANLTEAAKANSLEVKETALIGYSDKIAEQLISDERGWLAAFLLDKGSVYPNTLLGETGVFLLQVSDVPQVEEKDFKEKSTILRARLLKQKRFIEELKFLTQLEKEADLKVLKKEEEKAAAEKPESTPTPEETKPAAKK